MRSLALVCILCLPALIVAQESQKLQLAFQNKTYELAFGQSNQFQALNEYVPAGETLEDWSSLIAVRQFGGRRDFRELAGRLVQSLNQKNPLARAAVHGSSDGRRTMVDFITWDLDAEITEFNVFIYQLGPDGNSVLAHQYAERVHGKDAGLEFMRELKDRRMKMLAAVSEFKFPSLQNTVQKK
jgi:hypothetical protein